jgi:ABC-type sugar transport system ATPase subunit
MQKRIAFLSADRSHEGILHGQTVKWNSTIACIEKILTPFINKKLETEHTQHFIDVLNVKVDNLTQEINELSGGNQQKVLLGRWLYTEPDIIIMEEPTRGIDVNSKAEIYKYIENCVETGKSVIVVSSEIPELLGICNRVLVMKDGRVVADLDGDATTQDIVLQYSVFSGSK